SSLTAHTLFSLAHLPINRYASNNSPPSSKDEERTNHRATIPVYPNDAYSISDQRQSLNSAVYEYIDSHDTRAIELTSFKQEMLKGHEVPPVQTRENDSCTISKPN
ncbi:hypothetical protein EMCRGX_G021508, partial [Ephydatia muelleri]